jgi:hypothetical protein
MRMPGVLITPVAGGDAAHVHPGAPVSNAFVVTEKDKRRNYAEINYTRKLARWNLPDAQANIWFMGGIGGVRGNDFSGTRVAYTPGIQFDYETTRLYAMASSQLFRAKDIKHDANRMRVGFSFYEVNYDELQPWLLLEVRKIRTLTDRPEVSPMFRIIHKRWFVDLSVDLSKQPKQEYNGQVLNERKREAKLNVMYTY